MEEFLSEQNLTFFIFCGVGLGVLLAISALASLFNRNETMGEVRSRRMRMIREGRSVEERLALLKPPTDLERAGQLQLLVALSKLLRRSGLPLRPGQFMAICLALVLGALGVLVLSPLPLTIGAPLAVVIGIALPVIALRIRVDRQTKALIAQLPDALELMARGLRVGHPLNTSIGAVASEMPDPIGSEFGIIYDQVSYGDDLPEAFQDFAERVDIEDIHYLSASIGIQHGTGSDLSRVIELLARVIRGRIMLRRKVKAISAEGRASAAFLSVVPIFMFVFTSISSPNYYGGVMDDPLFIPMAATVVILTVLNALILTKLVNFHV
ncbi:MAG: type II secretion system F family protein [Paracoccaceae bacterium]